MPEPKVEPTPGQEPIPGQEPAPSAEPTPAAPVVEPKTPKPSIEPAPAVEPAPTPEPKAEPIVDPSVTEIPQEDFISSASTILTDAGFDPSTVMERINANDGEVSVELYNELVAKTSKGQADVLVSGFKTEVSNIETAQVAENQKVYEAVGGEETWNKKAEWTKTEESGLTSEAAKEYTAMLQAGGVQAQLAAKALKEAYVSSPGFTADPNLVPGDSTPPAKGLELISRTQYLVDKKKARSENNGVLDAALDARAKHTMETNPGMWRGIKIEG